jgi:hypothetical protein
VVCFGVNVCMNHGALRAVKKLYIRLCAARNTGVDFNVCHNEVQLKKIQPSNQKGDESSNIRSQRLIYYNPFYGISAIPGEHF